MNEISSIIKEKSPLIFAEIQKAKSVLLHCHPSPDPDSVGSALALKSALEQMGKKATVIKGDSQIPRAFLHFPGANEIVEKNYFETDLSQFDLFIILDSGGISMVSVKGEIKFPETLNTIVIDHHSSNTGFAKLNLIDTSSPATSFILFQLFKEWNVKINHDIALNLFMGMYTDTGGFKYPPCDYRILEAATECSKIAPDYTKSLFLMENSQSKEFVYFQAIALGSLETFCNDSIAISAVSYDELQSKNISKEVIGGNEIANILKSVIGWNVGILMTETEKGKVRVNFRSRDGEKYDVSQVAKALGGGGHRAAAGVCILGTIDEAKKMVVEKIKSLYNL